MLKVLTIAVAGVLTAAVIKQVMDGLNAAKAKVAVKRRTDPRAVTRLRQDPRTGIYYPEG